MRKIFLLPLLCFLYFPVSSSACDCDVSSFLTTIGDADLSFKGTVVEESEVSYEYRNLAVPTKVKVRIDQKFYGIEERDTIEIVATRSWSGFWGLSLSEGDEVLLNVFLGEDAYVFPSHCCSVNILSIVNDSVHTSWNGTHLYKEYEQQILNQYGSFHEKVNHVRLGDTNFMDLVPQKHLSWKFELKNTLQDGVYWVYDIYAGKVFTKEYAIYQNGKMRLHKSYYRNGQLESKREFVKGMLSSERHFYEDGDLRIHRAYEQNTLMTEKLWSLGKTGTRFFKSEKIYNKEGIYYYKERNELKKLIYDGLLVNGKYVGEITKYDKQGNIIEQSLKTTKGYEETRWFLVGDVLRVENYKDGVLDGEYLSYKLPHQFTKKPIQDILTWKKGKLSFEKKMKSYIYTQGQYKNGEKDGEWKEYDFYKKRALSSVIVWDKGKKVSSEYFGEEF